MKWRMPWARLGKSALLFVLLLLLAISAGLWYLTTGSFQKISRRTLIAELQRATGGRVELGSFHTVPLRLEVEVGDFTIHGKEAAGQQPYAHVDHVSAVISLSAALAGRLGFRSLTLDHPSIHIISYPDGTTNQPSHPHRGASDLEQIFSLSARRLAVKQGELAWNDQRIPLDFSSSDVSANLNYSFLHLRYSGIVSVGRAETHFDGFRPVGWAARASFNLDRSGIQIHSLRATSERSQLLAKDVHIDFGRLALRGNYDLNLDLAQVAAVTRQAQLKSGALHLQGEGVWSKQDFAFTGSFAAQGVGWQDKACSGRDLTASGNFFVDPRTFSASKMEGQFLHGTFSADAQIANWQSPPKASKDLEQQGTLKIRTKNLSLAELLSNAGSSFRPLNKLRFAGTVSSSADVHWSRSIQFAQASVSADVAPPLRVASGQIPLSATASASYDFRSGALEIAKLSANTPSTQIRSAGSLATAVRISLSTDSLDEWQPLVAQLFPEGAPLVVNGHAAFNGTASGTSSNLRFAGNLQLQNFSTLLKPKSQAAVRHVHWDSLSADIQASPENISLHNAIVRRENATLSLNGTAGLSDWQLTPESPVHFRLHIQHANAEELAQFAGYDHEIRGVLSGEVQLSGTRQKPQGRGDFEMMDATLHGQQFDSVAGSVTLNGNQFTIANLEMARAEARISGAGTYDVVSKSLQLNLHGTNFSLTDIAPIEQSQIKIAGMVDFEARVSGTTAQPQVTADLHLRNVVLNDEREGDFLLNAVSHGADVQVTGRSNFRDAELQIDGGVRLRDQWPMRINFHFAHLTADPFLNPYIHNHLVHHSVVAGDLTLVGPLRSPRELNVVGNLSDFYAEAGKTSFRNDGPVQFELSGTAFQVAPFHILGENTDFSGGGSMQFSGTRALNFQGNGKLDLKLLQTYDSDITSSGVIEGEGQVTGTLDAPQVRGKLQVKSGAIADINLPSALSEINGALIFNQNRVTIENLSARVGGGAVAFTGHAELVGRLLNFDLNAKADSVRLRYPPGVSSTANADLHWSGSSAGSLLSGDITVTKLAFTPGFDFGAYLERTAQVSSLPQTDPVLNTIRLDLHMSTTPELQMQTSVIRLQGSADLHVRGSAAKPILLGRADVFEGEAYFSGTKYRLERGGITFSNPAVTTPFLDLEAITRIRDYDVTLSLTGDVSKPNGLKMNYRSDPPLPTADIIALLAFGQTTEESAQLQQTNQSAFSAQASNAMLAAALNATLNNRAQRLFGNSRIKIDPQGLESETSTVTQSGPAVTIEQQVKDNLTLSYTTDVSQTSQQVIRAEYNISKNVSIVAIRDQNGVVSFDVTIRRRKR